VRSMGRWFIGWLHGSSLVVSTFPTKVFSYIVSRPSGQMTCTYTRPSCRLACALNPSCLAARNNSDQSGPTGSARRSQSSVVVLTSSSETGNHSPGFCRMESMVLRLTSFGTRSQRWRSCRLRENILMGPPYSPSVRRSQHRHGGSGWRPRTFLSRRRASRTARCPSACHRSGGRAPPRAVLNQPLPARKGAAPA
jgi:hypothetical protein